MPDHLEILEDVQRCELKPGDVVLAIPGAGLPDGGYVARLGACQTYPGSWEARLLGDSGIPFDCPVYFAAYDRVRVVRRV